MSETSAVSIGRKASIKGEFYQDFRSYRFGPGAKSSQIFVGQTLNFFENLCFS